MTQLVALSGRIKNPLTTPLCLPLSVRNIAPTKRFQNIFPNLTTFVSRNTTNSPISEGRIPKLKRIPQANMGIARNKSINYHMNSAPEGPGGYRPASTCGKLANGHGRILAPNMACNAFVKTEGCLPLVVLITDPLS
jgi:hypothetical protein